MDFGNAITLVIPCRNEAGTIGLAIELGSRLPGVNELIVVEGNSNDKTHEEAARYLKLVEPSINCLLFKQKNKGKWDAVTMGIEKASNEFVSIWDADLTVSPEEQKLIHKSFLKGLEKSQSIFATGNRMIDREPGAMRFFNILGNYFFGYLWNFTAKQPINDSLCGSKIFRKSILDSLPTKIKEIDPYGDFSLIAASIINRCNIVSVPITYRARTYGQTNISRWSGGIKLLIIWVKLYKYIKNTSK